MAHTWLTALAALLVVFPVLALTTHLVERYQNARRYAAGQQRRLWFEYAALAARTTDELTGKRSR